MEEMRPTPGETIEDIWPDVIGPSKSETSYVRVALGNGTAYNIGMMWVEEDGETVLFFGLIDKGAYTFSRFVHWTYAKEKLGLLGWDAQNLADFINRQLGLTGKPQGRYERPRAKKEVECKMCGAPFKPEGIHKEVCPSCYSNEVNAGEHFEEEPGPEGDDTADHDPKGGA
jgi:hypothetical protein